MAVTIWDGATYKSSDVITTEAGPAVSVAVKKTDHTVWFRSSADGGFTWSSTPIQVGTLGSTNRVVRILERLGTGRSRTLLIVTNGYDLMWQSADHGRTWSAI